MKHINIAFLLREIWRKLHRQFDVNGSCNKTLLAFTNYLINRIAIFLADACGEEGVAEMEWVGVVAVD